VQPLARPLKDDAPAVDSCFLLANINTFSFDYFVRQKVTGNHLSVYIIEQLPFVTQKYATTELASLGGLDGIAKRVLELTFTSYDMAGFAEELGYRGAPFRWDAQRRALVRAELDAAFFHLYGLAEEDVDYVMDTFPIVKRRDGERFGNYRTKTLILDAYRKMADAIATGVPYETILDPPPADPRVAHPLHETVQT